MANWLAFPSFRGFQLPTKSGVRVKTLVLIAGAQRFHTINLQTIVNDIVRVESHERHSLTFGGKGAMFLPVSLYYGVFQLLKQSIAHFTIMVLF